MNIPRGYVTFLFSDIEGSTKLAQKFEDSYQDVLKLHNSIVNEAIIAHNGFVFKTVGDAFCAS
ncbi:MAG: adenylate/guanylate cyclase domain-containing protein, partial [Ignavibacteria bacterium]